MKEVHYITLHCFVLLALHCIASDCIGSHCNALYCMGISVRFILVLSLDFESEARGWMVRWDVVQCKRREGGGQTGNIRIQFLDKQAQFRY